MLMDYLYDLLDCLCCIYIPQSELQIKKSTHPWLNTECERAIERKCAAEGCANYEIVRQECADTLRSSYCKYIFALRDKISELPKGSKKWWSLNRELLCKKARVSAIPPLKNTDGQWLTDPKDKANLFADAWSAKCQLPEERDDPFVGRSAHSMQHMVPIRARTCASLLKSLDVTKATGPDKLAARILREMADELALPLTILCRRMLNEGVWPRRWRIHHLAPVFKRLSVYQPSNYRGIHLTNAMAKTAERLIGNELVRFLQNYGFGSDQWAFRKKSAARDMALYCVASWIHAICCCSCKLVIYLGDIAGAFDRVFKEYLLGKLASAGVPDKFLDFLSSYLEPRIGYVTVEGVMSEAFVLCNTVFQGTVLGPTLWNVFFNDVSFEASSHGGEPSKFADDLTVMKKYPLTMSNADCIEDMRLTQNEVHRWGRRYRVTFEASKEHIIVIHPAHGEGDNFRLVGCLIDVKLIMEDAVCDIVRRLRPKIRAMLRTRLMHDTSQMIVQFKTHIWGIAEYQNGSIMHASPTILQKLDNMQSAFLQGWCH